MDASPVISAVKGPAKWGALALLCALAGAGVTYGLLARRQDPPRAADPAAPSPAPSPAPPAAPPAAQAATAPPAPAPATPPSPSPSRLININTAPAAELELLPGIGPALALRIVEHRASHGPFRRVQDLDAVKGIGPRTLERLAPLIRVE